VHPPPPPSCLSNLPPFPHQVKNWQRFRTTPVPHNFFANNADRRVHGLLLHLLCLNVHHHPLEQDLLLAHDAIIDLPVVEVERMRDGGG